MRLVNLLADQPVNEFWAAVIPTLRIILVVLMAIAAVLSIVFIFLQLEGSAGKSSAITGNNDSYYSHNKSSNKQGRVTKVVIICVSSIALMAVLYFLSFLFKV